MGALPFQVHRPYRDHYTRSDSVPACPGPSPTRVESEPEPAMHRRPHRRQGEGVPLFAALDILFEANTIPISLRTSFSREFLTTRQLMPEASNLSAVAQSFTKNS